MLVPLRPGEINKLIPAVATGSQFSAALGSPRKILQRLMVSSIGGVITLLISQSQVASRFYSIWLILGVVILLYILWGPIVEAGRRNSKLRKYSIGALFNGFISDLYIQEIVVNSHEQANKYGRLERVESRRKWLYIEIDDEDGYLGKISFPMDKKHQVIRNGMQIRGLIFSNRRDFSDISAISDAFLPGLKLWIGEYPYLLRPAFEEFCQYRISSN